MGKESSKIKDILFVTGADLDPEQFKIQKKHNPTKDAKVDYKDFTPKKFYKKDATDEQVQQHLKKLQAKQEILKNFKYYKDFDRINFREMQQNVATFEVYVQQLFKLTIIMGLINARIFQVQFLSEYYTTAGLRRFFWPTVFMFLPVQIYRMVTSPEYHIANHEYFRLVDDHTALYQQFDLQLNLYKDVQDTKYRFKYPKVSQFYKVKRQVMDKLQLCEKGIYREYFEYYNNLKLDKYEQFIKQRQQYRKTSKDLIAATEKDQIMANLQKKEAI